MEAVVITLLIIVNAAQLLYAMHLENVLTRNNKVSERFVTAFNEIMLVVNTNADAQRLAIIETETHEEKIAYLLMLNDVVFKALGVTKAEFKANSDQLSAMVTKPKNFGTNFPDTTD